MGSRTLATYNYASNNGYLQGMTYGNGYTQSYTYDRFGNMAEIKYGNTTVLKNFADSSGAIIRTQDLLTNYEHRVSYDSTGRLISKELLDLSVTGNADKWLHSLEYNFDANNNVTHFAFADKNRSFVTAYEYGKDNLLEKTTLPSGKEVGYTYDNLGRLIGKNLNTSNAVNATYTYHESLRADEVVDGVTKNYTTLKIASEETPAFGYKYSYDELGNISAVYEGVKGTNGNYSYSNTPTVSYVYDANGQLTHVNDFVNNEQYEYVYNSAGNITRRYRYAVNSDWQPASTLETIKYVYADTNGWKDLMTKYNGQTITYDAIGNPLNYRDGITMTWQNGRELASFTNADTSVSYTYDASGMRTSKTLTSDGATDTVKYVYENGLLLQMQYNHMYFDFIYDANGNPVSMAYRSTVTSSPIYYYYGLNSRGDVIALYYNTGALYAKYTYDVYGKLLSITNSSGSPINTKYSPAKLNPLRYRGYVYDNETGFYYLQSRYYDPTTCRFVNGDGYCSTGQGFNGLNMFAYCNNNPVVYCDTTGTSQTYTVLTIEGKTYTGVPGYHLGCYGQLKDYWIEELTEEQKVFVSTVAGEAIGENVRTQEAVAYTIMNRYNEPRDAWSSATSVSDILTYEQYNAVGSSQYNQMMLYLENRTYDNLKYEMLIDAVIPIYNNRGFDFTCGAHYVFNPSTSDGAWLESSLLAQPDRYVQCGPFSKIDDNQYRFYRATW